MSNSSNSTVSFSTLLQVLFIGLKLGKVISWSWWWVFAPTWVSLALVLVILAVVGVAYFIVDED